tara:strand:+ start:430 stop:1506 length:1077 start_codon:yes stop_codon:yes gene_type:complete
MKVCIIGIGLTSLALAKTLVNKGIYVDIFTNKYSNKIDKQRTIGISKANVEFFNKNILKIDKLLWKIKKIEIYSQNHNNKEMFNFENKNDQLFSIVKNHELYKLLNLSLKGNSLFNLKRINKTKDSSFQKKYNLVFNCDVNSFFSKKYFYKKINKNYNSIAHTMIINHDKLSNNDIASQVFTEIGPLAFLPVSKNKTSIVYSVRGNKNINLIDLIKKFNLKYSNIKVNKISSFKLKSSNLRSYYFQNILAFGDELHKIHPLAGQGFNMTIRDIKELLKLIKSKVDLGLDLDSSICKNFEKKTKHKNYLFSRGVDFIYEAFSFESKMKNSLLSNSISVIGKNKYLNKFLVKFADEGIII